MAMEAAVAEAAAVRGQELWVTPRAVVARAAAAAAVRAAVETAVVGRAAVTAARAAAKLAARKRIERPLGCWRRRLRGTRAGGGRRARRWRSWWGLELMW